MKKNMIYLLKSAKYHCTKHWNRFSQKHFFLLINGIRSKYVLFMRNYINRVIQLFGQHFIGLLVVHFSKTFFLANKWNMIQVCSIHAQLYQQSHTAIWTTLYWFIGCYGNFTTLKSQAINVNNYWYVNLKLSLLFLVKYCVVCSSSGQSWFIKCELYM